MDEGKFARKVWDENLLDFYIILQFQNYNFLLILINSNKKYSQGLEFSVRVAKKSGGEGARFTRSFAANNAGKVSDAFHLIYQD